jgi:hypothetical protein
LFWVENPSESSFLGFWVSYFGYLSTLSWLAPEPPPG